MIRQSWAECFMTLKKEAFFAFCKISPFQKGEGMSHEVQWATHVLCATTHVLSTPDFSTALQRVEMSIC